MKLEQMKPIPPNANPYHFDFYHMGVLLTGKEHVHIMYTNCLREGQTDYLIIINTKTGKRVKVEID